MAIEVFNRYEHKYKVSADRMEDILAVMDAHMVEDIHCAGRVPYTIANIYYDTHDDALIRASLSKPLYKEKLRVRSYGVPRDGGAVYLEIKKKFNGLVNKRRTELTTSEAYDFCRTGEKPEYQAYMNSQVLNELEYFIGSRSLVPKVYIAYDRLAYFERENDDLRISFDTNIRTRRYDLRLEEGDYGTPLIRDGSWLMEIKTSRAMPLWLAETINKFELRRCSFSKYGTEFRQTAARGIRAEYRRRTVPRLETIMC